jgi:hypothetical protein
VAPFEHTAWGAAMARGGEPVCSGADTEGHNLVGAPENYGARRTIK